MAFILTDAGRGDETSGTAKKPNDCANGGEQEMVMCVAEEYKAADLELNKLYKQVKEQSQPEELKNLVIAQRAWIKHRDAQCESEVGPYDNSPEAQVGSYHLLYSGEMNGCLLRVTLGRVKALRTKLLKLDHH
jgi:uncharacterized protein YecT (DUF1311 family)